MNLLRAKMNSVAAMLLLLPFYEKNISNSEHLKVSTNVGKPKLTDNFNNTFFSK